MEKKILKYFATPVILIISLTTSLLVSCDKEDDFDTTTPPEIYDFHTGTHDHTSNEIVKTPGAEVIVDFKVRSLNDGRLDAYHIEIHDHPTSGNPADEYIIIDDLFDNEPTFKGTRNATVHKHIAIPEDAPLGEYHVEVVVFDEYGNTGEVDALFFLVKE